MGNLPVCNLKEEEDKVEIALKGGNQEWTSKKEAEESII